MSPEFNVITQYVDSRGQSDLTMEDVAASILAKVRNAELKVSFPTLQDFTLARISEALRALEYGRTLRNLELSVTLWGYDEKAVSTVSFLKEQINGLRNSGRLLFYTTVRCNSYWNRSQQDFVVASIWPEVTWTLQTTERMYSIEPSVSHATLTNCAQIIANHHDAITIAKQNTSLEISHYLLRANLNLKFLLLALSSSRTHIRQCLSCD